MLLFRNGSTRSPCRTGRNGGALTLLSASLVEGSLCISHAERMELQSALLQEGMHKPKSNEVPAYETCLKNLEDELAQKGWSSNQHF